MNTKTFDRAIRDAFHPDRMTERTPALVCDWVDHGYTPPRYSFLTTAYVEALGLDEHDYKAPSPVAPPLLPGLKDLLMRPVIYARRAVTLDGWQYAPEQGSGYRAIAPAR